MSYLLDTNVISEGASKNPEAKVLRWCEAHRMECRLSCITLGEIWRGIHLLPTGKRRNSLIDWVTALEDDFPDPVLPLDAETFKVWGELYGRNQAAGRNLQILDSLLAAVALQHDLILATRNTTDFPSEVRTFNPWL